MTALDAANPVMKAFLAGSLSGTCSTLLFQPLDLIKTRLQQQSEPGRRLSMLRMMGRVVAQDNLAGLWRGVVPSLSKTVPGVGLYFSSMHHMKTQLYQGRPSHLQSIMIGCTARTVAGSVMIPFTVIKTRFESRQFNYTSVAAALRAILATEGVRGLTLGLVPTLARDVPFSGLYLMFYEHLKTITPREMKEQQPSAVHFLSGMTAGVLASLVTQPADVIKTQLQLNNNTARGPRGVLATANNILQTQGVTGFTTGFGRENIIISTTGKQANILVPRAVRRTLMAALAWTVYEKMIQSIGLK